MTLTVVGQHSANGRLLADLVVASADPLDAVGHVVGVRIEPPGFLARHLSRYRMTGASSAIARRYLGARVREAQTLGKTLCNGFRQ